MSFQGPTALTRSPSILTRSPSKIPLLKLPSRDDDEKIIDNVTHQNNGKIYKIPFLVFPKTSFDSCNNSRDPKIIQNDDDVSENIPMTPYIDEPYIPDYVNIPPNVPQNLPQNIPQIPELQVKLFHSFDHSTLVSDYQRKSSKKGGDNSSVSSLSYVVNKIVFSADGMFLAIADALKTILFTT